MGFGYAGTGKAHVWTQNIFRVCWMFFNWDNALGFRDSAPFILGFRLLRVSCFFAMATEPRPLAWATTLPPSPLPLWSNEAVRWHLFFSTYFSLFMIWLACLNWFRLRFHYLTLTIHVFFIRGVKRRNKKELPSLEEAIRKRFGGLDGGGTRLRS